MQCLAINKNGKCCRNYTQVLEDGESSFTCSSHRNYFNNLPEFKEKVWQTNRWQVLHLRAKGFAWRVGEWLRHGLLKITEDDIRSTNPPYYNAMRYANFLLLLARHTKVDLHCVPELRARVIREMWKYSWRCLWVFGGWFHNFSQEDLATMICGNSLKHFYDDLYLYAYGVNGADPMRIDDWYAFFEFLSQEKPDWWTWFIGHSLEEHRAACLNGRPENHRLTALLFGEGGHYWNWLEGRKQIWKMEKKDKIETYKEELIAVTSHPSRFLQWTLDQEELHDMAIRWDSVGYEMTPLRTVLEEVRGMWEGDLRG